MGARKFKEGDFVKSNTYYLIPHTFIGKILSFNRDKGYEVIFMEIRYDKLLPKYTRFVKTSGLEKVKIEEGFENII